MGRSDWGAWVANKIVISEFMDETALDAFATEEVRYDPGLVDQPEALRQAVSDADALIVRNRTRVDAPLLAAAPSLRVVGRLGVGLENIDLEACADQKGHVQCQTRDRCQHAIGRGVCFWGYAVFAATVPSPQISKCWLRAIGLALHLVQGGEVPGADRSASLGFGEIAQAVAQVGHVPFGMNIIAFDPYLADTDPAWTGHVPITAILRTFSQDRRRRVACTFR